MNDDLVPSPQSNMNREPNFSPQSVIDSASITNCMDKNKKSLKVKLMLRRPINVLVDQGILPPPKSSPTFYEQKVKLERAITGDFLKHKIQRRPIRDDLIQQHILEEPSDPSYYEQERKLKKARLADDLNERLSQRPGPLELIKGNILHTDESLEQAIKDGQITFKKTCEGEVIKNPPRRFVFEEESSSDSSPSPQNSNSPLTSQPVPPTVGTTYHLNPSSYFVSNTNLISIPNADPVNNVLSNNLSYIVSTPVTTILSNDSSTVFINSNNSAKNSSNVSILSSDSNIVTSSTKHIETVHVGSSKSLTPPTTCPTQKSKKKNKSKNQPKARIIKFHEYTGPPNVKKQINSSQTENETSYELLLKQQQLFLQWQLEKQQKYSQFSNQRENAESDISFKDNNVVFASDNNSIKCEEKKGSKDLSVTALNGLTNGFNVSANKEDLVDVTKFVNCNDAKACLNANNANTKMYAPNVKKIISKLEDMKVSDLKAELKKRNLPVSGPKQQLIERLKPYSDLVVSTNNCAVNAEMNGSALLNLAECNKNIFNNVDMNINPNMTTVGNSTSFILNNNLNSNLTKNNMKLNEEFVFVTNNSDTLQAVPLQLKASNSIPLETSTLTIPLTNPFIPQYQIVSSSPTDNKINLNISPTNSIQPQLANNILVNNKLNIINPQANLLSSNLSFNQTTNQVDKNSNLTILTSPQIQLASLKNNVFNITHPAPNLTNKLVSIQNPAPVIQQFLLYPTTINPHQDITNVIASSKQRSNSLPNESLHQLQRNTSMPLIISQMHIEQHSVDPKVKNAKFQNDASSKSNSITSQNRNLLQNQSNNGEKNVSKEFSIVNKNNNLFSNSTVTQRGTSQKAKGKNCFSTLSSDNRQTNNNSLTCSNGNFCGPNTEEKSQSVLDSSSIKVQPDSTTSSSTLDFDFMLNFDDLHDAGDVNGNNILKSEQGKPTANEHGFSDTKMKNQNSNKSTGMIDFNDIFFEMNFGDICSTNTNDDCNNNAKLCRKDNPDNNFLETINQMFEQTYPVDETRNNYDSENLLTKNDQIMFNNSSNSNNNPMSAFNTGQQCHFSVNSNSFNVDPFSDYFMDDSDFKDNSLDFASLMDKVDYAT